MSDTTSRFIWLAFLIVSSGQLLLSLNSQSPGISGGEHQPPPPAKPGAPDRSIVLPLARVKPDKIFAVPGSPDWIAVDERDVWISNKPRNSVTRIDSRLNIVRQTIAGLHKPCSGLAIGFGSLWVPNCGNSTLARIDLKTGAITQTIPTAIADSEGGLATGAGSLWLLTSKSSILARIDPATNKISNQVKLPAGCYTAAFGYGSVWVTCTEQSSVVRIDPATNKVAQTIRVGPQPRFLACGEGAIWTLNQGDGSVTRISPGSGRVEATVEVGIPGEGGDISAAEGAVWTTAFGFPISRIDPHSNKVTRQFAGKGGDAIRAGNGFLWLSNYMFGTEWKIDPAKLP